MGQAAIGGIDDGVGRLGQEVRDDGLEDPFSVELDTTDDLGHESKLDPGGGAVNARHDGEGACIVRGFRRYSFQTSGVARSLSGSGNLGGHPKVPILAIPVGRSARRWGPEPQGATKCPAR